MSVQVTIMSPGSPEPDESAAVDSAIITIPDSVYAIVGEERALDVRLLTRTVLREATEDFCHTAGKQLHHAVWTITSNPEEMRTLVMVDECATCRAGAARARAYLQQHPGREVAVGQLWWARNRRRD